MKFQGRFTYWRDGQAPRQVPNIIVQEGQLLFLLSLFQQVNTNFSTTLYVGLCNQLPAVDTTLVDITTEPDATGGYARLPLVRNNTDWPSIYLDNGNYVARSKQFTWTPTGANFSAAMTRLFLSTVSIGSAGNLISMSGALAEETTLEDGVPFNAFYEVFIATP